MKSILSFSLCALLALSAARGQRVHEDFEARFEKVSCPQAEHALKIAASPREREAMEFMYAYMEWADLLDHPAEYFLENARVALRTRSEMPWGADVPDREWHHFVLPVRVNNEALDDFRTEKYEELKQRVRHLPMAQAALEVNHWCHEHVTYRPSDGRTSSPLATLRTATGRCGEESTLTVAALRTVGIPARQVYTPRWAHTDDNHAWVEAYVDGKWQFMGACEPAPELNIAWFNQPASRGMLMNTTVLGKYQGDEQVLLQMPLQTTINVTGNYAPTLRQTVRVTNRKGKAVVGAVVRFGLYNYAEFYPLFTTRTDAHGEASIVSGHGDLVAWASDGTLYGFAKISPQASGKARRIVLEHKAGEAFDVEFTLTPPAGSAALPRVPAALEAVNNRRLAYEDSVRMDYVHSWPTDKKAAEVAEVLRYDYDRICPLFRKSEGNYMALFDILEEYQHADSTLTVCGHTTTGKDLLLTVLETLTDKDLRDFDRLTLSEQVGGLLRLAASSTRASKMTPEAFERLKTYVFCPRVAFEQLTPWRKTLPELLTASETASLRGNAAAVADYVNSHVRTLDAGLAPRIAQSPEASLTAGYADAYSKGICFVALCRTLGLPARLDAVTMKFQYYDGGSGSWSDVSFAAGSEAGAAKPATAQHRLTLGYEPRPFMENPGYYYHFTLSRLDEGMPQLQNYGETDTWKSVFAEGTPVDDGDYVLISGTRLASGAVLTRVSVFPVKSDTTVSLKMLEDKEAVSVIGSFNSENTYHDLTAGKEQSILATTGRGYFAVGLLRANNEPSTHILHDIELQREALEAWGREIVMLFPTQEEYDMFSKRLGEFPNLPRNLRFGVDTQGQVGRDIFGSGLTHSEERPVVLIGDTFNRVVFFSQGYTIGMGQQLVKTLGKL